MGAALNSALSYFSCFQWCWFSYFFQYDFGNINYRDHCRIRVFKILIISRCKLRIKGKNLLLHIKLLIHWFTPYFSNDKTASSISGKIVTSNSANFTDQEILTSYISSRLKKSMKSLNVNLSLSLDKTILVLMSLSFSGRMYW